MSIDPPPRTSETKLRDAIYAEERGMYTLSSWYFTIAEELEEKELAKKAEVWNLWDKQES